MFNGKKGKTMKRFALTLLSLVALCAAAQPRFGYFNFREVLTALPEYATVQANLKNLREKCEAEINNSEKDFIQRYSEFIDGQAGFPDIIRDKRQKELQELMERSIAFKKEADNTISAARREMLAPLRQKVPDAAKTVCQNEDLDYVVNTDRDNFICVNDSVGIDISLKVRQVLGLINTPVVPEAKGIQ